MSYTKTNWTDGTTPVDASNMNKIEDALSDQDSRIDANTDLINESGVKVCVSGSSYTDLNDIVNGGFYYLSNTDRDNIPNSSYRNGYLIVLSSGTSANDYKYQIFFSASSARMWFRRKTTSWGSWAQVQTETVS